MQIIKKENWIVEMFDRDVWMIIFRLKSETNFSKKLELLCAKMICRKKKIIETIHINSARFKKKFNAKKV